ncbi:MAG: hypothetical protein WBX00_15695 [Isosphaeraceae bacterium]
METLDDEAVFEPSTMRERFEDLGKMLSRRDGAGIFAFESGDRMLQHLAGILAGVFRREVSAQGGNQFFDGLVVLQR